MATQRREQPAAVAAIMGMDPERKPTKEPAMAPPVRALRWLEVVFVRFVLFLGRPVVGKGGA